MRLTDQQLDKYISIFKENNPDKDISREDALSDALKLLDLVKIVLQAKYENNKLNK